MKDLKVSVVCTNYNKGDWIKDALDGCLMQECSFDYEILVIDDCSTDKSRKIIEDYAKKYPKKIRAFYNKKNLGITKTWIKICKEAKGEYIARCDGDDYWTKKDKLQMQIDALKKAKHSKWCSTDYDVVNEQGIVTNKSAIETGFINRPKSYAEQLVTKGMTMSSTWLVDAKLMQEINKEIDPNTADDTFDIQLELFYRTKPTYVSSSTTAYRITDVSDSRPSSDKQIVKRREKLLKTQKSYLNKYPNFEYKEIIINLLNSSLDYDYRLDLINQQKQHISNLEQHISNLEQQLSIFSEEIIKLKSTKSYKIGQKLLKLTKRSSLKAK